MDAHAPAQMVADGIKGALNDAAGKLKELVPGSSTEVEPDTDNEEGKVVLRNRAGESRSPYVRGHKENPVAWQLWGDEAIELAKKENKLLFVSIGYSACHCMFALHTLCSYH